MQWNSSLIVKISKASVLQEWPVAAPLMLPGPEHVHKSNNDSLDLFLKDCQHDHVHIWNKPVKSSKIVASIRTTSSATNVGI